MGNSGPCSRVAVMFAIIAVMIGAVASAPAEDLIPILPGQPSVQFKQYGGYITVDEKNGRALFYYFVEAETDPATKPLTLWLNGGPGCSSLGGGGFSELGPFFPTNGGKALTKNNDSWAQVSNILFLESPAGVGFSYSNTSSDYTTGDFRTAKDSLSFLLGWFKKFPEYQDRDFYISGESYAGHYAPQLAAAVLENNKNGGDQQIRLKGVMIGNPLFDYEIDTSYSPIVFLWSHGLISDTTYTTITENCHFNISDSENADCLVAQDMAATEAQYYSGYVDPYDVLGDTCVTPSLDEARRLKIMVKKNSRFEAVRLEAVEETVSPCVESDENVYLNLPEVQEALHARKTNWALCSSQFEGLKYKDTDLLLPMLPILQNLYNCGLRVWIFSGDQDSVIPLIGTRQLVDKLSADLKLAPSTNYTGWFEGQQIGGWTRTWENLTYATVKGAGHLVPRTQPTRALQLFTSFLSGNGLPLKPINSSLH